MESDQRDFLQLHCLWHVERGHYSLDRPRFAGFRWPCSTRLVVLGQAVGNHNLAIRIISAAAIFEF